MKILKLILVVFVMLFATACKKDAQISTVNNSIVSQGTYFGVVHLNWDPVPDAIGYNIERQDAGGGDWVGAGTVSEPPFDDYGFGLPDNKIKEGVHYSYRISTRSDDKDDSEFSPVSGEGWIYDLQPITMTAERKDDGTILISWADPNQSQLNVNNLLSCYYIVKRRYEDQTEFTDLFTTSSISSQQNMSYTDANVANDKKAYYKIQGRYHYRFKNMDWGTSEEEWDKNYNEVQESGGTTQVNYSIEQLGDVSSSNNGYSYVVLKNINNEMYAATLDKPAIGKPVIYKINGTTWQNISNNYPSGLQNNFLSYSICGNATNLWVAGVSDSAYVYSFGTSWSDNLLSNNFGLTDIPDELLVEYNQNTLYALCDYDNKLEVYTYSGGTNWNSQAVLENGNGATNIGFKAFNGTLYAYYLFINSESNSSVRIKHYDGSAWQTDFDVAYDNILNVKVYVDNSGAIYFTAEIQESSVWKGNVYKVTSSSSAQKMIASTNTWLTYPSDVDNDDMGNLMVVYGKYISESSPLEMHLAVYENNEWKDVAGDFSNHIDPSDIESNNGLYFVYGDGTDVTNNSFPVTLKAVKLTHK